MNRPAPKGSLWPLAVVILAIVLLILNGCGEAPPPEFSKKPISRVKSITNYPVEFLFTVDGCKVYRFTDYHSTVFLTCPGATTFEAEHLGKNNWRLKTVQTIAAPPESTKPPAWAEEAIKAGWAPPVEKP